MNYAALSSISRICKRIPATLGSFSRVSTQFRGMGGGGEGVAANPLFSRYFVQRRKAIGGSEALFRARTFKLIMDGRIYLSPVSLYLTPPRAILAGEGRKRPGKGTQDRSGDRRYIRHEWIDGEWVFGWGRPHKYGNFVNQVS